MKKIYSFFTLLLACMIAVPAFAQTTVVTKIGEPIKDMSSLKVGDKVLLYCNGPVDPADKEYGTRNAFLCEADNYDVNISRDLRENALNSSDYIWEIIGFNDLEDGSFSIQFKSPRGNYLPNFIDDIDTYGKWARWMGRSVASIDSVGTYVMSVASNDVPGADSLFYFQDENGVFFNGQDLKKGATTGTANFVGWNTVGGNSLYMVYKPEVEDKTTYNFIISFQDEYGNPRDDENAVDTLVALVGDTIQAPAWQYHSFISGENSETGESVEFPYVVKAENVAAENFFTLTYEVWSHLSLMCVDADDPERILDFSIDDFFRRGAKVALPTERQVGLGYELVGPEEYLGVDSLVMPQGDVNDPSFTPDLEVILMYKLGNKGVPFKTSVVEGDAFAENTNWYVVNIRGNRALSYDEGTAAVGCQPTEDYTDAHLWAFSGDLVNGFKVYNKAAGPGMILWATDGSNATQLYMTAIEETIGEEVTVNTFDLDYNNDGFSMRLHGTSDAYINEFGGSDGDHVLKFWTNSNAKTDDGSRLNFIEFSEEWGNALRMAKYNAYINAENCVGGWTADLLVDLKAAVAAKDTTACNAAVEELLAADTIAFDAKKAYVFVNASKGFVVSQPGKTYAMAMSSADSSLVWKELDATNKEFHFGFRAANDSAQYIVAIEKNLPVGGFRFKGAAKGVEWGGLPDSTSYAEGIPAPFQFVKVAHTPAAYAFVHNYGASKITLTAMSNLGEAAVPRDMASDSKATEGFVGTYNTLETSFKNYWRMMPVGEWNGIESTVVANPGVQKEVIFDLSGRRVQKAVKGLYIINGKKVFVK